MALDIIRSKTDPAGLIPMDVSMPAELCLQNLLIELQIASQCKSADVIYQLETLFSAHLFKRAAAMVLLDQFETIFLFLCRDARLSKFEILLDVINKMVDGMTSYTLSNPVPHSKNSSLHAAMVSKIAALGRTRVEVPNHPRFRILLNSKKSSSRLPDFIPSWTG